jgi:hypothetical protein
MIFPIHSGLSIVFPRFFAYSYGTITGGKKPPLILGSQNPLSTKMWDRAQTILNFDGK